MPGRVAAGVVLAGESLGVGVVVADLAGNVDADLEPSLRERGEGLCFGGPRGQSGWDGDHVDVPGGGGCSASGVSPPCSPAALSEERLGFVPGESSDVDVEAGVEVVGS